MRSKSSELRQFRIAVAMVSFLVSSAAFAATVVVTSAADTLTGCAASGTGECTLRDAITFSNANPGPAPTFLPNLIQFNIPGGGVQTIVLNSVLPAITAAVVIDGYSQPGASPNTLDVGNDAVLLIQLLGGFRVIGGGGNSLHSGSTIRGLVINHNPSSADNGVVLTSCCNTVAGNFVGLDPTGTQLVSGTSGVTVDFFSNLNIIGGSQPADRNALSGVGPGIHEGTAVIEIDGGSNFVEGNYVGTNAAGSAGFFNPNTGESLIGGAGVLILGPSNTIGGPLLSQRNLISGNRAVGVRLISQFATGNVVVGNFIGTDATGIGQILNVEVLDIFFPSGPRPFLVGRGVEIGDASENHIGTALSPGVGVGNRILYPVPAGAAGPETLAAPDFSTGVDVKALSLGVNGPLFPPVRDSIVYNTIQLVVPSFGGQLGVAGPGINLHLDNLVQNSNRRQSAPQLTDANSGVVQTNIHGALSSTPDTRFRIQFFSSHDTPELEQVCQFNGSGTGDTFLGETFVMTDSGGNASFTISVPLADAPVGQFITATATDPAGNTSEFSACEPVVGGPIRTRIRFLVEGPVRVAPGVPVEFRFKVETEPPKPTGDLSGEVFVSDDVGELCRAEVSSSGEGACSLTFPSEGVFRVRAHYEGNAEFADSTSPTLVVLVGNSGGGR